MEKKSLAISIIMAVLGLFLFILWIPQFFICSQMQITLDTIPSLIIPGIFTGPLLVVILSIISIITNYKNKPITNKIPIIQTIILILSLLLLFTMAGTLYSCDFPEHDESISNALLAVSNGGSIQTQAFTLQKGDLLTSKQFSDDGFDQQSIIFAVDKAVPKSIISVAINTSDIPYSFFKYNSETSFKANARVVCDLTGTSLIKTIDSLDLNETLSDNYVNTWPTDLCGIEEYTPCCLVIIQRAR